MIQKKILSIIGLASILAYIFISMSFVSSVEHNKKCDGFAVTFKDSTFNSFFSSSAIQQLLVAEEVNVVGKPMVEINTNNIELKLANHPWLRDVKCYKTVDGKVRVEAAQRIPLFRVMNAEQKFYVDKDGSQMPVPEKGAAHVLVVTGVALSDNKIDGLLTLASFIDEDSFWKAQIEQIEVKRNGNLVMVPKVGNHIIRFGTEVNIISKFSKLKTIYLKEFATKGWNRYKEIDLRFNNQIVCTKK